MAKKNRINACWLLLLTLLYTAAAVLSVGQSEARYNNTVISRTMVNAQNSGVTSNCLVSNRDPAVTVLAGELNLYSSTNVSFWLHSSASNATGTLRWGVVNSNGEMDKELSQYVRVTMQSGADIVRQQTELELLEDVPMELTMIITPTETARNTAHKAMKINVAVTWGDSLWGTFQVILPEVESKEDPEAATQPEETVPEESQPQETQPVTEPEETQPEQTQPEDTQPEDTQPEETQPVTEPEETESATQPEETESNTEPEGQAETQPAQTETAPQTTAPVTDEASQTEGEKKTTVLSALASLLGIDRNDNTTETTSATEHEQNATQSVTEPAAVTVQETAATESSVETATETTTEPTAETTPETTAEPAAETVPETATEPTVETTPETVTEPTVETVPEETTEPTEPEEEKDPVRLETLGKFDSNGMLPVRMVMTEKVTSVRLGLGKSYKDEREDPKNTPLDVVPLPAHTRFSLDDGKSYYMLADSSVAEFAVDSMKELEVLLDFRYTGMQDGTGFRLVMDAYEEENRVANCTQTTICSAPAASVKATVYDKSEYEARLTAEQLEQSGEETVKLVGQKDNWVLNQNTVLELTLPDEWQDADLKYNIELLTVDEDGALAYKLIDLNASGLVATHNDNREEHSLVLKIGDRLPQAGTYRINMEWTYGDLCYIRKQTTFFINYAADAGYLLGGLEVS